MYNPPIVPKNQQRDSNGSHEAYPGARAALEAAQGTGPQEEEWRASAAERAAEIQQQIEAAKQNRVYVAMGPIVGAILIGNLITALVVAAIYAMLR